MQAEKTCAEIVALTGGRLTGTENVHVNGVASLLDAEPTDLSFFGNERYRDQVLESNAGIVLVPEDFEVSPPAGRAWIVCKDPSAAFSKVVGLFASPPVTYLAGRHAAAVIDDSALVAESAHIGACAVIDASVVIGENTVIGAGTYVGEGTTIGRDCLIYPNVSIRERCILGNRLIIHSGTTIGSDGFGFIPGSAGHTKIPQVGIVQIDDDVEIGAQVAIDRARFGKTWIKQDTKIDNLVQIAHNVVIGKHCFIIAQVGISGSTTIGDGVIVAGQAGIAGHLSVGDRAVVMGQTGVTKDVPAGARLFGTPGVDAKEFARSQFTLKRLERAPKTLKMLEKQVAELQKKLQSLDH